MDQTLKTYFKKLKMDKKSSQTIKYYERVIKDFVDFVKKDVKNVNKTDILSYKFALLDRGLADTSVNTYLLAIQSFFSYLIEYELYQGKNPAFGELISVGQRHPEFLTDEEIIKMIKASRSELDKALILTLVSTGLRFSELATFKFDKIQRYVDDGETWARATVIGKGNKERLLIIPPSVLVTIENYYYNHRPETKLTTVFVNREGNELDNFSLNRKFKSLARKAKLENPDRVHAHLFRHTFATMSLRNGVGLAVIQDALGHKNIATTKMYAHTDDKMLIDAAKANNKLFAGGLI